MTTASTAQLGYCIISRQLMQRVVFLDLLFDTFEYVSDISTPEDKQNYEVRIELRSDLFVCGYTQYTFEFKRQPDGEYKVGPVVPKYVKL